MANQEILTMRDYLWPETCMYKRAAGIGKVPAEIFGGIWRKEKVENINGYIVELWEREEINNGEDDS